jgi:hypothetical protein
VTFSPLPLGHVKLALTVLLATSGLSVVQLERSTPALGAPVVSGPRADAPSAASQDVALQIAQMYGHDVQVSSQTTEVTEVVAQPDGSLRSKTFAEPVRVARGTGWTPVDDTVSFTADGTVQPAATEVRMKFSGGGTGPLASVQAASGQWLSVYWPEGPLPVPTLQGDAAVYADVLPGVDLRVAAGTSGFSEVLVIKTAAAAAQPELRSVRFSVDDGSLTSTPDGDGGLQSTSSDGTVQLREGQPTWWDSAGTGADATGPADNGVPRPLLTATSTANSVTIDASAVADTEAAVYPVFVDPSWSGGTRHAWTFTDNAYPTTNYLNGAGASDAYAHSGFVDAAWSDDGRSHLTRAYFGMNIGGMAGKHIISAQFNAKLRYSSSCTATDVALRTANSLISSSTTWNSQPVLGTLQDTKAGAWQPGCQNGGSTGLAMGFNATQVATNAAAAGFAVVTLALVSTNESNRLTWKKFYNNPFLAVTYNSIPTAPAYRSVRPCYAQCGLPTTTSVITPTLTAQSRDSDGGNLRYSFEVWASWSDTPAVRVQAYQTPAIAQNTLSHWIVSNTPPAGQSKLVDGHYEYRVRAFDGTDYSAWSGGWIQFAVDTSKPGPPTVTISGATSDPNTEPASVVGTVGAPITVGFGTSEDASLTQIAYSLYDKIPVYSTPPACGSEVDAVIVLCRSGGVFPAQTIAAPDTSSTLYLMGWDSAGNRSATGSQAILVNEDVSGAQAAHTWRIDSAVIGSIPDLASSGPSLSEGAGVTRGADAPNPSVTSVDDDTGETIAQPQDVSVFTGAGALKTTATGAASVLGTAGMASSFTFTAWVKPTAAAATSPTATAGYAVAAVEGSSVSGFFIDVYRNQWRFCMPSTQNSTFDGVCAVVTGVVLDWNFVAAQWDAVNKQLRFSVGTPSGSSAIVKSHPVTAAASGVFDVGVRNQPGQLYPWVGRVFAPTLMQAIASSNQLTALWQYATPAQL